MQVIQFPDRKDWKKILLRPAMDHGALEAKVEAILSEVKEKGDDAVRHYSKLFDKVELDEIEVSASEIEEGCNLVNDELKHAIKQAKSNIEAFHMRQVSEVEEMESMPGVRCWRKSVAIERV